MSEIKVLGRKYALKRSTIDIEGIFLDLEILKDLNKTIDDLFSEVEVTGNSKLLEDLCPYFGTVWPAALELSRAVARLPIKALKFHTVLEIGCGLALPSLIAAKREARVTATDFHPDVETFLEKNMELNRVESIRYLKVDCRVEPSPLESQFDWVLASDVLYEKEQPPVMARTIANHLKPGGKALLADPGRPYLQAFSDEAERNGLNPRIETVKNIFLIHLEKQEKIS